MVGQSATSWALLRVNLRGDLKNLREVPTNQGWQHPNCKPPFLKHVLTLSFCLRFRESMLGVLKGKTLIRLPSSLCHPVGRRIPSQVSSQVEGFLRCPVSSVRIIFRVFPDLLLRVTGPGLPARSRFSARPARQSTVMARQAYCIFWQN